MRGGLTPYKPALLQALVDLSVERAPADGGTLILPSLRDIAERVLEEARVSVMTAGPDERSVTVLLDLSEVAQEAGLARRGTALAEMAAEEVSTHGSTLGFVVERVATALERSQIDPRPFLAQACVTMPRHTSELYSAMVRVEPDLVGPLIDVLDEHAPPRGASARTRE